MPVTVRNQNSWKATGAVVGGGPTGGIAGTLAKPFSANSAWNSPFTGSEVWQTFSQLPKNYGFNTGASGGTNRVWDLNGNGTLDVNIAIINADGSGKSYRGYPAGTIAWRGVSGMAPSPGADAIMNIIWTSPANGLRYSLDLWLVTRISDTSFTAQAFGITCVDGISGNVPGKSIGGKALYAAGNGWGDHAPNDFNAAGVAGVTETEANWLGGLITSWSIASGGIDFALACALPGAVLGNVRYRPSLMPWHGANGPLMQGMRIGFPGAPRSTATGIPKLIADAALDNGIFIRDAHGWTGVLLYVEYSVNTSAWLSSAIAELNKLAPFSKVTTTVPNGISPAV